MIRIVMSNGYKCEWGADEYTEYKYDGNFFILIKGEEYIGVYNLDYVISIEKLKNKAKSE